MLNLLGHPITFSKPRRVAPSAWTEHIPFAFAIMEIHRPGVFVELGTHRGISYCAFCQATNELMLPTKCYAVDTWKGDEHTGYYTDEVFEELNAYHAANYSHFSNLMHMTFDEASKYFMDGTIDLLHIDGLHLYDAVRHDLDTWLPKMSSRGVVLLHDSFVRERDFGVGVCLEQLRTHYPVFEFTHGYGLAVVGVGHLLASEPVLDLFKADDLETVAIRRLFSTLGAKISCEAVFAESWTRISAQEATQVASQRQIDENVQTIKALQAALKEEKSRAGGFSAEIESLRAELLRFKAFEAKLTDEHARADGLAAEIESLRAELLSFKAFEAKLTDEHARADGLAAEIESLRAELLRFKAFEAKLTDEHARADGLAAEIESLRAELLRFKAFEAKLTDEHARADGLAAGIESLRAEMFMLTNTFGFRAGRFLKRIISWNNYDGAYQVWKKYKKQHIDRHEALEIIGDKYGVRSFFLLYPLYKTVKPLLKFKRFLVRNLSRKRKGNLEENTARIDFDADWYLKCYPDVAASGIDPLQHYLEYGQSQGWLGCQPKINFDVRGSFDPSKLTMLLVTHEASQTGAPIIAFNLLEKFASRYNVISVLLGPGNLENAFKNISFATIGPFETKMRHTHCVQGPILAACREFAPAFAVVNSIESREALIPLSEARVPSILLVHEFASLYPEVDWKFVAESAGQMVFPARRVWEDAVAVFPWLAVRPANIITQGPCRIPREWLDGEPANDEQKRIASVMRPLGPGDDAVVVMGCGVIDERKGVDLFISAAAALQRRSPSRRFRFVWVGPENPYQPLYSRYLAAQVNCCGVQGTVKFLGEVNSVASAYAMADIFLLSSRLDPFPNVAIDAMLAGLPVICFSNGSGVAEMLSNHVDLKRLVVPYADASSAAEVIERLCNDGSYLRTTKTSIRDLAHSAFDMDRYVERLDQLAQRASLIMRQKEEDAATISRSDTLIMEYAAPPGFSAPREIYIKSFVREGVGLGGLRCPFPGFHPGIYRNAHPELNEPPFVNPLAHFIRNGESKGPWLLDVITPGHSPSAPVPVPDQRVALHLHIYYPDLTPELFRPIAENRTRTDIFATVSSEEGLCEVTETAAGFGISIKDITVVPNRGRDVGPLLTLLGRSLLKDYDIIGHLHTKKSPHIPRNGDGINLGKIWRSFCIENLLGGKHAMMDVILDRFAHNSKLGIVFPCDPNIVGWTPNRPHAMALLERMGIVTELPQDLFIPVGTMFWARADAIAPLLQLDLTWSDYPPEPLPIDGTILHAIERLFPVVAQHRGFEIAGTYVPGVTR